MGLIAWRSIVCHKIRSALLAMCVVIGVAFVAGTYVLTDTIKNVFQEIFDQAFAGVDVNVRSRSEMGNTEARDPLPDDLLAAVREVPGVDFAAGNVFTFGGRVFDADGEPIGNQFAPTFLVSWPREQQFNAFTLESGTPPRDVDEVVIDLQAVTSADFELGDQIQIQTLRGVKEFTLVGIAKYGEANNMGGASAIMFDLPTAQREANRVGVFDGIMVAAEHGVDAGTLQDRVQAVIGTEYEALTGDDVSAENASSINDAMSFFTTFLLVFAAIALLVGAFIVYNTFAIVVAQRTREMALLRALGADGRQVIGSIIIESVIVGLVASAIGLVGGIGLAMMLKALLNAIGFGVPGGSLTVVPRTIIVSVLGGVLITVLSAVAPAVRASRVPPLAAVRSTSTGRPAGRRSLASIGAVLSVVGAVVTIVGARSTQLAMLGLGALCVVFGVSLLAPTIVAPFVRVLAVPIHRFRGLSGQLAEENATRSARRTANAAAALMIGTAVIAASLLLSRSIGTSTDKILDQGLRADLIVRAEGLTGFGPDAAVEMAELDGVQSVAPFRFGSFKVADSTKQLSAMQGAALDPTDPLGSLDLDVIAGSIRAIDDGGVAIDDQVAESNDWVVGDTIPAVFATGSHPLEVTAIYRTSAFGSYMISLETHAQLYTDSTDFLAFVRLESGTAIEAAKARLDDLLTTVAPAAKVQDRDEYAGEIRAQVNQILNLITALVLLAIIIALLGVLITMLLSIFERTHELGLLRAVGMDRRDVRAMVRWEAAIIATFGATLGAALGIGLGYALTRTLRDEGVSTVSIPYTSLLIMIVLVTLAGVVASIYPARRAGRLNVLSAIAAQ